MNFFKKLFTVKNSETIKIVIKIAFFILKQIFKKNCDGENKKG